jgi:hypothetical protein
MLTSAELIALNTAILNKFKTEKNQDWVDLLIQLELTQTDIIKRFQYSYEYYLADNSYFSRYYAGNSEPEFIELLTALHKLKKLNPETSQTLVSELINEYIADSVQLADHIIRKSDQHFLGKRKDNLLLLIDNVNKTTALLRTIRQGGETESDIAALVESANTLELSLAGPLYRRSVLVAGLIGVTACLVAVAILASPFFIVPALHFFTTVNVSTGAVFGTIGSIMFGVFGSVLLGTLGFMQICDAAGNMHANHSANKTANAAKKFAHNAAGLFAPKSEVKPEEIEMSDLTLSNRAA